MTRRRRADGTFDIADRPARRSRPKNRFATQPKLSPKSSDPRADIAGPDLPWLYARRPIHDGDHTSALDPTYARANIGETPASVLTFWFGYPDQGAMKDRRRMDVWFGGGPEIDRIIAGRFLDTLAYVASGGAASWAMRGPREQLAAIICLDQFTRSIFRDTPAAFENDALARTLCLDGLDTGAVDELGPFERWFFIMPLMHAEDARLQARSVNLFRDLAGSAPPEAKEMLESASRFAELHAEVIRRFGRFPTRNEQLGRESTQSEKAYLADVAAGREKAF